MLPVIDDSIFSINGTAYIPRLLILIEKSIHIPISRIFHVESARLELAISSVQTKCVNQLRYDPRTMSRW